jgi:hypothetical protein
MVLLRGVHHPLERVGAAKPPLDLAVLVAEAFEAF